MARASRKVWSQRVKRWKESGLPASEFAQKLGLNENTLRYWATQLRKEENAPPKAVGSSMAFVEVAGFGAAESAFEIAFASGLTVRVPPSFDDGALQRLLSLLEVRR
jgi:transposase-like protein